MAVAAGKVVRQASRLRGGGSAFPGLVVERIDPSFLSRALVDLPRGVVVVTGTNGKTTTTRMLVAVLRRHGLRVFTNPTGSNFTRGVISSLLGEVPMSAGSTPTSRCWSWTRPTRCTSRLRSIPGSPCSSTSPATSWTGSPRSTRPHSCSRRLAAQTTDGVVLNRDDSFVSRIGPTLGEGVQVRYFGVDPSIADRLPELQEADVRFSDGFAPPPATDDDALLRPFDDHRFMVAFGADLMGPVSLRQRGLAAMINATAATATAKLLLSGDFASGGHQRRPLPDATAVRPRARPSTWPDSRWSLCW